MIHSVEDAYKVIGNALLANASASGWRSLFVEAPIWNDGCGGVVTVQIDQNGGSSDLPIGFAIFEIQKAVLYLRRDLLQATGARTWGLTFTLFPDGKFNIEYDYNKPKSLEVTDEVITGDGINSSLNRLSGKEDAAS